MTIQQEPEAGRAQAATTRTVRATSANARAGAGTAQSTVTAELPAVRGPAGAPIRRAPGINAVRRQSAPVAVRISVWLLALVLLVVAAGTIVAGARPDTLSVLRHTTNAGPIASTTLAGKSTVTKTTTPTFREVSASAKAVTYSVPAPSYELVIAVSSPTFIEGHTPANSAQWAFARTITPSAKPTTISITGTTTLTMFKTPVSLTIESSGKVLGSVAHPMPNVTYTFEPSSATS